MSPRPESGLSSGRFEVHVARGAEVESRHLVHGVVRRADDTTDTVLGDPDASAFWRSAVKPFQALPVLEDGAARAFGFDSEAIAVACASHGGRAEHLERVGAMLESIGAPEAALRCGPQVPYDDHAAAALVRAGERPRRIHNNCSGKHAAMLALAAHHDWDADGYWRYEHPVQRRIRSGLAAWITADPEDLSWATDGCGLPTPYLRLADMALSYARLVTAAAEGEEAPAAVVNAMTRHPELTSSPGREPLEIMRASSGRLLAKEGAEGVLCVAAVDGDWGLALKVTDGGRRAVGPAAVAVLSSLDLLTGQERQALASLATVSLEGTTGERVGELRAVLEAPGDAAE